MTEPAALTRTEPELDSATRADQSDELATTTLLRAAIGPVNTDYYLGVFTRFDAQDRTGPSWNTAAALTTVNWMLYRRMWNSALAYVGIALSVALVVFGIGKLAFHYPPEVLWALAGLYAVLIVAIPGLFGNALLFRQYRGEMEAALSANQTIADAAAMLLARAPSRQRLMGLAGLNAITLAALGGLGMWVSQFNGLPTGLGVPLTEPQLPAPAASGNLSVGKTIDVAAVPAAAASASAVAASTPVATSSSPEKAASSPVAVASAPVAVSSVPAARASGPVASVPASPASGPTATVPKAPATPTDKKPESPPAAAPKAASENAAAKPTPAEKAEAAKLAPQASAQSKERAASTSKPAAPAVKSEPADRAAANNTPAPGKARNGGTPPAAQEKTASTAPAPKSTAPSPPVNGKRPAATAAKATVTDDMAKPGVPAGGFGINVGLFADDNNARNAMAKLSDAGLPAYTQEVQGKKGKFTRVRVGPFDSAAEAERSADRIRSLGLDALVFQQSPNR